jgi:hypothetical protein
MCGWRASRQVSDDCGWGIAHVCGCCCDARSDQTRKDGQVRRITDLEVEDWFDAAARAADRDDQSEWLDEFVWRVPDDITDREAQVEWLIDNAREILEDEWREAMADRGDDRD